MFLSIGHRIWNFFLNLSTNYISMSPVSINNGTVWAMIQGEGFGTLFFAAGIAVLNLFFLIGFVRQAANLKQSYTLESFIEAAIKLVFANLLMYNCWNLMATVLSIAAYLTPSSEISGFPTEVTEANVVAELADLFDAGLLGPSIAVVLLLLYVIVAAVCGVMIFITVYNRHFQIFILATTAPLALSTVAGSSEISRTGYSWIRAFLGKAFEIVIIGIALSVGSLIAQALQDNITLGINGTLDSLIFELLTMILITASVKGADGLMSKVFAL